MAKDLRTHVRARRPRQAMVQAEGRRDRRLRDHRRRSWLGRRSRWLSNYHLAVRDGDAFADVGKTFKGFTDAQFVEMTGRLWALAVGDDGYTVRVRPEVVVEVAYNEIQKSPTYRSGMALRFARITRIRDDKSPGQATTLEELRALYERQFATKGRAV